MAFAPPLNQKFSGKSLYVNLNEGMVKNYSNFSKNRDISPFRKYTNNNFKKTTTKKNFYNNNIYNGNNNNFIKKITSPLSLNRSKSPNTPSILNKNMNKNTNYLNNNKKKFNNNNNFNNTNKIIRTPNIRSPYSISVNNSSKKLTPKITKNFSLSPYNLRNNNKLNSSNLLNNKSLNNIKNKTFLNNNNKKRSTTPVSKTKFSLNNCNSSNNLKFNKTKKFNNNNFLPNRTNSPFGIKNINNLNNRNSFSNNIKNQNRINYQNNFRSMNIFKGFSNKNKPNNFIFSFNMNQQEKNINGNNNIIIDNDNGLPKNISNLNNINNNISTNNNKIINNINNNITSTIIKNIKCMHDMSKTGYAGEDEKKINQDNYFVFHNFAGNTNYIFMSVCDGHGQVGQEISNYLKENLPISLNRKIKEKKINILTTNINNIIKETFLEENNNLSSNEMINSMLSGSTCVSVIYTPYKLITANVGDSRAFMGRFISNNEWKAIDLTRDHKPDLPDEKKRILSNNGVIEPMKDDDGSFIGPMRVWLKNEDYPGLAMSRSFGDKVAHSVGVIAEPEIKEYLFDKNDKFFIVASDGLFEFMSSQEIVNIVKDYYLNGDIVSCCEDLYKMSCEKWMKEEEVIDDITIILVFLE